MREATYTLMTVEQAEKFWPFVSVCGHGEDCQTCCWEWKRARNPTGYGLLTIGKQPANSRVIGAHRLAYLFTYGTLPADRLVCHHCDRPPCCNPAHLWLGTNADNRRDAAQKGRIATGERHWSHRHPDRVIRGERHGWALHPDRVPRGEQQGLSRLNAAQVQEIRTRTGTASQRALAQQFGVSKKTVWMIQHGKTWQHLLASEEEDPHAQ